MAILAIDPGTTQSGWALIDELSLVPEKFDKSDNSVVLDMIRRSPADDIVIEMISSYGKPVGSEVFATCVWIGRFVESAHRAGLNVHPVWRQDEKKYLRGKNDAEIKQMLILRFARFDKKTGKGTRDRPDWFFGFKADIWQAYAVGVTWIETQTPKFRTETASGEAFETNVSVYPPFS